MSHTKSAILAVFIIAGPAHVADDSAGVESDDEAHSRIRAADDPVQAARNHIEGIDITA